MLTDTKHDLQGRRYSKEVSTVEILWDLLYTLYIGLLQISVYIGAGGGLRLRVCP